MSTQPMQRAARGGVLMLLAAAAAVGGLLVPASAHAASNETQVSFDKPCGEPGGRDFGGRC